jgi:hypothetical protein
VDFLMLPKQAFLPHRKLSAQERQSFIERRDKLFSLCTPTEQRCVTKLAHLYLSHRHELLVTPNIFTRSFLADFYHRQFPWEYSRPNAIVRVLAQVSKVINKAERLYGRRSQAVFIAHLDSFLKESREDVLLGVVQFCRALPLEIDCWARKEFEDQLEALTVKCIMSNGVPALRRFDAAYRCSQWQLQPEIAPGVYPPDLHLPGFRRYMWRLLLEVVQEDMPSALKLIDEHWGQTRGPQILMSLYLHEAPDLAYQLAVNLRPYRTAFAADMLREAIFNASFLLSQPDKPTAALLEKVMDTSCQLLAEWTFESPREDTMSTLRSMGYLLRFGNPDDEYWQEIPRECLAVIKDLTPKEQEMQLSLLAEVVLYGSSPSLVDEALGLFEAGVASRLGDPTNQQEHGWAEAVSAVSHSLSLLEDKKLSFRNRHVAACPEHILFNVVRMQLQSFLEKLLATMPSAALQHFVTLTLELDNEKLIRSHHQVLRAEFEARASNFPVDAGCALKRLIEYCGYSQVDDQMYRKVLCEESFQALLPVLEGISPSDADIARTGIGRYSRMN